MIEKKAVEKRSSAAFPKMPQARTSGRAFFCSYTSIVSVPEKYHARNCDLQTPHYLLFMIAF
jgi:hypothetical protein